MFPTMSCGTLTSATKRVVLSTYCDIDEPIAASVKDTPETKRRVIVHNEVYDALCGEEK